MKITLICPCWGRPQRTLRALDSILEQDFTGAEIIFIGDACPLFQERIDDGTFEDYAKRIAEKGNVFIYKNLEERGKGWGHMARKEGIEMATGKYICFLDNDDMLLPNHLTNYYEFIEANPEADVCYFNARTVPWNRQRDACLTRGGIGNAELLFKAQALKDNYEPDAEYEHDWRLVDRMMKKGYTFIKSKARATYMIMSVPNYREKDID